MSAAELSAVNLAELEPLARERLDVAAYHYFAGGAADELTMRDNRAAFDRLVIVPRVLRGVSEGSTATTVLGAEVAHPVLVAPMAYQRAAHPDGELAIARAAAATGTGMCLSSLATSSIEDVAAAAGPGVPLFFQLYPYRDRGMTEEVIHRAREAGYRALMVTVDVPVHARRERQVRHSFVLPDDWALPCVPVPRDHEGPLTSEDVTSLMQPDLDWGDVERFMALAGLPVVLKGVLSPDDARIAAEVGAAGVVVSNHGGRQLDTTPATIDVLAEVVDAVQDRIEVLLDGGIRRGTDVVKALALGARAVLVGRPVVWGLAAGGEAGVRQALAMIADETRIALALCGCARPDDVTEALVRPARR